MLTFGEFLTEAYGYGVETKFHKDHLGFPANMPKPRGGMSLRYHPHAMRALQDDYITNPPKSLPSEYTLIEATYQDGMFRKWLVRFHFDTHRDLVMSITPDGLVITCWVNDRNDLHKTLDRRRYSDPRVFRPRG